MAASNLNLGKASGGVLNIQPADGTTTTSLVLPAINGTVVAADSNGNVGIGVTPSNWNSNISSKSIQLGYSTSVAALYAGTFYNNAFLGLTANSYVDASAVPKYITNSYATQYTQSAGTHNWQVAPSGTAGNAITWTNAMTLDTNGRLDVNPIGNSGAFRAYITGTSNVSYESKSSQVASTNWLHFYGLSSNGTVANIAIYGNGNVQNANNSYGSLSDIKLKENIVDATPKLDKLMKIRVVNYNLIGDTQKQIGVIAQEIEKIFPGVIDEVKDTKQVEVEKEREVTLEDGTVDVEIYTEMETVETGEVTKNVKYSVIYMMMLKGLQELNGIVKEQNEIIKDLKSRIEILEAK